jgi:hypothetical protein
MPFHGSKTGVPLLTIRYPLLTHNCVRLNLYQHLRRNQFAHFHHARRRPYRPEKFSMRPPNLFPLRNIRHKNPRPHHILQSCSCLRQRGFDVLNRLYGLRARVAHSHNFSIRSRSGGPRDGNHVADPHRSRIPDNRLPSCSARNILPCQMSLLCLAFLCLGGAAC